MATPSDDDFRTIGLPRGAMKEVLKGAAPPKEADLDRTPPEPRPPEPPAQPPRRGWLRSALRPSEDADRGARGRAPRAEDSRPMDEAEPRDFATAALPPRRPAPPPPRPAEPERSPGAGDRSRPAASPRHGAPALRPPHDEPEGRPLDDFSTNMFPGAAARLGRAAAPEPPLDSGLEGRPFDETSAGVLPAGFGAPPVPSPPSREPETSTDTPWQFAGPARHQPAPAPPPPAPPARSRRAPDPDEGKTVAGSLPAALGRRLTLQFFDNSLRRWKDLGVIGGEQLVLSREFFRNWDSNPEGLAEEHLRITLDGDEISVEPLETLNGAYRKLAPNRPEELPPGTRFRIGRHVLEFRPAGQPPQIVPRRSVDGEVFQSRVLVPQGFLDLIGPDSRPYLSFPLTKAGDLPTSIGRTGAKSDIALTDEWVSTEHARLFCRDGKCWLEDLGSTNGTFIIIDGPMSIRPASGRNSTGGDELLVGGYKIRVIEERA